MGDLIRLGAQMQMAKGQYKVDMATKQAEKLVGTAQIEVDNMLAETNAQIANALRGENNTLLAARAALGNWQKSAKAEAMLKEAGSKYNALGTNVARVQDQQRAGTLERRIQMAEQQGALTAAAAAAGTGGASQRMLRTTLAATMARRETRAADAASKQTYEMLAQQAGIMSGVVTQLDQGQVFVAIDHTKTVAPKIITPMWQADFMPSKEAYVLNNVAGLAGATLGNLAGKAKNSDAWSASKSDTGAAGTSDWWSKSSADISTGTSREGYLAAFDRDGGYYGRDGGGYSRESTSFSTQDSRSYSGGGSGYYGN